MTVKLVEPLHPHSNPSVASLYDKLNAVILEHCENSPVKVTSAEVIGTIEFIKATHMGLFDK